jgi:hypothetical protein
MRTKPKSSSEEIVANADDRPKDLGNAAPILQSKDDCQLDGEML